MPKIAFIGAGSFGFTRALVRDVLTFPRLRDSTIALMDIDRVRLGYIKQACERIVREGKYPATITATTNRAEALKGADAVIITILQGGFEVFRHDVEIPKRYGVNINVGDTRGPAGIFRALRTIPALLEIVRDAERVCPQAVILNYTNPMAMNCLAMQSASKMRIVGLCHSVQGTADMLAGWLGLKLGQVDYLCAGINHQAWMLRFARDGRDLYPRLRRLLASNRRILDEEQVRNEMFLQLGYYVTESSGHNSEYNAWFRKRPDLIEKYCARGTGWNPGEYAFILKCYRKMRAGWRRDILKWLRNPKPLDLSRGGEYATPIINAILGGEPCRFNGNVLNAGLIANLDPAACVEVPIYADRSGFNPVQAGPLPPQLAALNAINVASELMACDGMRNGDPTSIYHAICYDPLTSAVLSLAEIKKMVNEMLLANRKYLRGFKRRLA